MTISSFFFSSNSTISWICFDYFAHRNSFSVHLAMLHHHLLVCWHTKTHTHTHTHNNIKVHIKHQFNYKPSQQLPRNFVASWLLNFLVFLQSEHFLDVRTFFAQPEILRLPHPWNCQNDILLGPYCLWFGCQERSCFCHI